MYGSIFFILTGFHGFHVTVGTLFLWFCLVRALLAGSNLKENPIFKKNKQLLSFNFSAKQHIGFEAAAWY